MGNQLSFLIPPLPACSLLFGPDACLLRVRQVTDPPSEQGVTADWICWGDRDSTMRKK